MSQAFLTMAELSISVVPAKILADGTHKIRIRISHKHSTRYILTRFKIDNLRQFQGGKVVGREDAPEINKKLRNLINRYYDALDEINPNLYTCTQICDYLENYSRSKSCLTVRDRWEMYINDLKEQKRSGTAGLHELSLRYFSEKFHNVALMAFSQTNVTSFERHLYNKGLGDTSVCMHMKRLKVIINAAIKDGMVEYKIHPFAYYRLPEVSERILDLTIQDIKKIRDYQTDSKSLNMAKDVFMLSYYLGGINLIDLVNIDFRNMSTISYIRTKTAHTKRGEKKIILTIPGEAKPIIQKWAGTDGKLDFKYSYSYSNLRDYIGHELRRLGQILALNKRICYYSARKSFVQHGFELGIPLEILEYTIGQSVKKNRPIYNYIRFMQAYADEAIRKILDNLK